MITRQELEGQWNEVKGKIQKRWGGLTDDELQRAKGNANELVGVIQQRTGETRRAVEEFLSEAVRSGENMVQQAVGTAREYADQAAEVARKGYDEVATRVHTGLYQAQQAVRRNPMESVAVAFGAGLIAGVVTGLILKSR
jgi:uncharacterized protein YjbJ (UPF0337 family)